MNEKKPIAFSELSNGWFRIVGLEHRLFQKVLPNCAVTESLEMFLPKPDVPCIAGKESIATEEPSDE